MSASTFDILSTSLHWTVAGLLAALCIAFLTLFVVPSHRVKSELRRSRARLNDMKTAGRVLDLDRVATEAMPGDRLSRCWKEYRDTLHAQRQPDEMGMLQVARWRATAMAGNFFTEQSLVDTPLRTEFFKHMPGVMTGLGIIGTFSGLILGLNGFQVTDDATIVRASLATLIQSVGGAFVVSAAAIGLAMIATFWEKVCISRRYAELEQLCAEIDGLFDAGAGEEYLQRLVEASETSATQALQMKESLVTDLKEVLTELSRQQIATMNATSAQLGGQISASLNEGLKEPLARISDAVQTVGNSQGDAVNRLLTDVLSSFAAQMEGMFGSQLRGMNEMLERTAQTIGAASERFEQLAGSIEQAGSGAADAMARRIEELMASMTARQNDANAQMATFIEVLKTTVSQGQADTAEQTRRLLAELGGTVASLVAEMRERAQADAQTHGVQQQQAAEQTRKLLAEMAQATGDLVNRLQSQTADSDERHAARERELAERFAQAAQSQQAEQKELADTVEQASAAMRDAIDRLQAVTTSGVERMNAGAEKLNTAAVRLTGGLDDMSDAADAVGDSAEQLVAAGKGLDTVLAATQHALTDHRQVRDALSAMVADLRATVETAKREASMTTTVVEAMDSAARRLVDAQRTAEGYLDGVGKVLEETHAAFAKQMELTLRKGNASFHEELGSAVRLLKGAIVDLSEALESLPTNAGRT